jgi:hypothetical protein
MEKFGSTWEIRKLDGVMSSFFGRASSLDEAVQLVDKAPEAKKPEVVQAKAPVADAPKASDVPESVKLYDTVDELIQNDRNFMNAINRGEYYEAAYYIGTDDSIASVGETEHAWFLHGLYKDYPAFAAQYFGLQGNEVGTGARRDVDGNYTAKDVIRTATAHGVIRVRYGQEGKKGESHAYVETETLDKSTLRRIQKLYDKGVIKGDSIVWSGIVNGKPANTWIQKDEFLSAKFVVKDPDIEAGYLLKEHKLQFNIRLKGGPGSGFHGHAGRPGEVGGSADHSGMEVYSVAKNGNKRYGVVKQRKPDGSYYVQWRTKPNDRNAKLSESNISTESFPSENVHFVDSDTAPIAKPIAKPEAPVAKPVVQHTPAKASSTATSGKISQSIGNVLKKSSYDDFVSSTDKVSYMKALLQEVANSSGINSDVVFHDDASFNSLVEAGARKAGVAPTIIRAVYFMNANTINFRNSTLARIGDINSHRLFLNTAFHEIGHAVHNARKQMKAENINSVQAYDASANEEYADKFSSLLGTVRMKVLGSAKVPKRIANSDDYDVYIEEMLR